MIVSVNPKPNIEEFRQLMKNTDSLLNKDALKRPKYYEGRNGNPLEDDVKSALDECAKGTPFEGTIEKVSGQRFPDIVAARYYGVEVKSTKSNHWKSTGSSILETTRVDDVDRIYMTFGKLGGNPIEFLSKPYEECLYDIAVTHMPRYLIDMQLTPEQTIFAKMNIPYDTLRSMEDPIKPVADYYRKQLKPGESLWWTGDAVEEAVSAKIRLWKTLTTEEKRRYMVYGCVNFPEVVKGDYDRYALWLTSQGVVDSHIRDQFSAGGQGEFKLKNGEIIRLPAIYRRIRDNCDFIIRIMNYSEKVIVEHYAVDEKTRNKRIREWIDRISKLSPVEYDISVEVLNAIFKID